MDWDALWLSLRLGGLTVLALIPLAVALGRWLAVRSFRGKAIVEAAVALPLVLPPTVLGFICWWRSDRGHGSGKYERLFGHTLVFSFQGLLVASVIINIPFAVQPIQRAFEAIAPDLRDAAATCGMPWWRMVRRIELPLAWPGILTGMVLTFAHTLGEFGVVLMVGGSVPGETKTIAISIYDRVQAFDDAAAGRMAALLLLISLVAIALATHSLSALAGAR
jgi:molybdate transport system permease protein